MKYPFILFLFVCLMRERSVGAFLSAAHRPRGRSRSPIRQAPRSVGRPLPFGALRNADPIPRNARPEPLEHPATDRMRRSHPIFRIASRVRTFSRGRSWRRGGFWVVVGAVSGCRRSERQVLFNGFEQVGFVEVGVDFRGDDAFVPQHLLHLTDACAPFEQVGGERVAESVGADALFDAGARRRLPDDREDHHAGQRPAPVVEEYRLGVGGDPAAVFQVNLHLVPRHAAHGHEPLFVPLARDTQVTLAEKEVRHAQRNELRHAEPARVEHFEHGAVAAALDRGGVHRGDDPVDLARRENVG